MTDLQWGSSIHELHATRRIFLDSMYILFRVLVLFWLSDGSWLHSMVIQTPSAAEGGHQREGQIKGQTVVRRNTDSS